MNRHRAPQKTFKVTLDNSANADDFNYVLENQAGMVPARQAQEITSKLPIVLTFDCGDGREVAHKELAEGPTQSGSTRRPGCWSCSLARRRRMPRYHRSPTARPLYPRRRRLSRPHRHRWCLSGPHRPRCRRRRRRPRPFCPERGGSGPMGTKPGGRLGLIHAPAEAVRSSPAPRGGRGSGWGEFAEWTVLAPRAPPWRPSSPAWPCRLDATSSSSTSLSPEQLP